ncbi:MAG TPA: RAMP superfamily CRISPR-associated protein [Blastocatellia bacterium]|nr:RAMP superfamily CRISPR-associated protein [Blastocatellia bacterium]HMX29366.1 RAMP superfamily CRISPR-associated protein [Blastocatellia bacterium]HNG28328.1 RAMP superfamily CRISPR-associated protein [Blastocatellia bacterium]
MPIELKLEVKLLSDATFGRGDGVAGLIDAEVEHDEYGLPYLRGRTIRGLLVEECANIFYALAGHSALAQLEPAAAQLFGCAGSTADEMGKLKVGSATLPEKFRMAVAGEVKNERLTKEEILNSMTTIRRQTAIDTTGAPLKNSLRSMRVVLRDITFTSTLTLDDGVGLQTALSLLAACALGLRRGGTGRNRGRGRLSCKLLDANSNDITQSSFDCFRNLALPQAAEQKEAA